MNTQKYIVICQAANSKAMLVQQKTARPNTGAEYDNIFESHISACEFAKAKAAKSNDYNYIVARLTDIAKREEPPVIITKL